MKRMKYPLYLILSLILMSCNSNIGILDKSTTPTSQPIVLETLTPSPVFLQYQLTYVSDQHEGFSGVYAMDVGCLDQEIPCFSKPYLLFELSSPQDIASIAWSPNGKQIVFVGFDNGNSEIFVSDWNGENKIDITNSGIWKDWPVWTPDGTQIMYETKLATNRMALVIKDLKGQTIQELLTKANLNDPGHAVFNRDGSKIVFEYVPIKGILSGFSQIYIADRDGENLFQLTQNLINHYGSSLSPDGSRVVVEEEYNVVDGYSNLVIFCLDGTCNNAITERNKGVRTMFPAWAPFDDWIAYTNHIDFTSDIYLVKKDGSVTLKLTQTNYSETYPAWRTISP